MLNCAFQWQSRICAHALAVEQSLKLTQGPMAESITYGEKV